jgi:hypothetical protein
MMMVVRFCRQTLMASETRRREVASSAEVASSVEKASETSQLAVADARQKRRVSKLTENKHRRIPQPRPRNRQPLPLPSRKTGPLLPTQPSIIPLGQVPNKVMNKGTSTRRDDLLPRHILGLPPRSILLNLTHNPNSNIIMHRPIKQNRSSLRNTSNMSSQPLLVDPLGSLLINLHPPFLGLIKTEQQTPDRRLATARSSDYISRLLGREVEANIL